MKKKIFIIYIIGYVISYFTVRNDIKTNYGTWTTGNRNFALLISLGSWLTVTAVGANYFIDFAIKNRNEPAKW